MVLADAAAAPDGKHYIHGGGWDRLFAASFPVVHPLIAVAVRLRVGWLETNRPHHLELDVVTEDGQSILPDPPGPLRVTFNVGRPVHLAEGDDQVVTMVFNLAQVRFVQAGLYAVLVRLNGAEADRSPFHVSPLKRA